jgi:glycosyltransferase involved in cell wall biosynthesis
MLINPHEEEASGGILPFKLIEYLVAGGVVITTRDSGLTDEVFDYCEITTPDSEALAASLERVLANSAQMIARAKKGQAWAISKYSETAVAESIHHLMLSSVVS